jgi:hypothetical protein
MRAVTVRRAKRSASNDTPNYVVNLIFGRPLIVSELRKEAAKISPDCGSQFIHADN